MNDKFMLLLDGAEDKYPQALEKKHPHVLAKLLQLWKLPTIDKYFDELMMNTRDGKRKGFSSDVAMEIFNLSLIHDKQHIKQHTGQGTDVWGHVLDKKPKAR